MQQPGIYYYLSVQIIHNEQIRDMNQSYFIYNCHLTDARVCDKINKRKLTRKDTL